MKVHPDDLAEGSPIRSRTCPRRPTLPAERSAWPRSRSPSRWRPRLSRAIALAGGELASVVLAPLVVVSVAELSPSKGLAAALVVAELPVGVPLEAREAPPSWWSPLSDRDSAPGAPVPWPRAASSPQALRAPRELPTWPGRPKGRSWGRSVRPAGLPVGAGARPAAAGAPGGDEGAGADPPRGASGAPVGSALSWARPSGGPFPIATLPPCPSMAGNSSVLAFLRSDPELPNVRSTTPGLERPLCSWLRVKRGAADFDGPELVAVGAAELVAALSAPSRSSKSAGRRARASPPRPPPSPAPSPRGS